MEAGSQLSQAEASNRTITGNTVHTAPENRIFYPALDGLRAVALLLVFFQHYLDLPWGNSGVNVFFVLSGFLITGILWDTRDHPQRVRNFYIRRTLRIFPLYYGIFLLLVVSTPLLHWEWSRYWVAWPLYLGNFLRFVAHTPADYTSNLHLAADGKLARMLAHGDNRLALGHFWSLCVEEQFYLVWPWVVFLLPRRKFLMWTSAIIVFGLPFLRYLLQPHLSSFLLSQEVFYRFTPFQLDSLLLGALLAFVWRGSRRKWLMAVVERIASPLLLLCLAIYLWSIFKSPMSLKLYSFPAWRWTWGLSLTNVLSAVVIVRALQPGTWIYRALSFSWLRWLGRISYGGYIFHDIFHGYANERLFWYFPDFVNAHPSWSRLVVAFGSLGFTVLAAHLSFRYFETPFLNLKEKWARS